MLKLRIYESEIYEETVTALINENSKELIMSGDDYHNKINERIEGFLQGLDYANTEYEMLDTKIIKRKSKMYSICGFDEI